MLRNLTLVTCRQTLHTQSCLQDPSTAKDTAQLFNSLSVAAPTCDLKGQKLPAPPESSKDAFSWLASPICPQQCAITAQNAASGLHTLTHPPKDTVLCTMVGSGTVLNNGGLDMGHAFLVLDGSCSRTLFSELEISGVLYFSDLDVYLLCCLRSISVPPRCFLGAVLVPFGYSDRARCVHPLHIT